MTKEAAERVRKAQDKGTFDNILETVNTLDFAEIVGRVDGDAITYRVYNDSFIYEK